MKITSGSGDMGLSVTVDNFYEVECWRDGRLIWEEHFHNLVTASGLEHIIRRVIVGLSVPVLGATVAANVLSGRAYPDGRRVPRDHPASGACVIGDIVQPVTSNQRMYITTNGGTMGAAPTWPTTNGGTATDGGGVVWYEASGWWIGLKGAGVTSATNTMATSSRAWTESTIYSESTRQLYVPVAPVSGSTNNASSKATFSINAAGTLNGAFCCDLPTKSGTAGLLYGVGDFSIPKVVQSSDSVAVTCTCTVS